jgi:hypothetical protein
MTPTFARRLGKAVALLGSAEDGEVIGAARSMSRLLESGGMDWHRLAAMVAAEAARQFAPAFTFATAAPRTARKLMAHLARQPTTTQADRVRLAVLRARLLGARKSSLSVEEVEWLDRLWVTAHGPSA